MSHIRGYITVIVHKEILDELAESDEATLSAMYENIYKFIEYSPMFEISDSELWIDEKK